MQTKRYNVQLRSGKVATVDIGNGVKGGKMEQSEVFTPNTLAYAHFLTMAVVNPKIQCEQLDFHDFDGTMATHMVKTKFKGSNLVNVHYLCKRCSDRLHWFIYQ